MRVVPGCGKMPGTLFAFPLRAALSRFAPLRTALSEAKRLTVNSARNLLLIGGLNAKQIPRPGQQHRPSE
jgi:hypothetical protein